MNLVNLFRTFLPLSWLWQSRPDSNSVLLPLDEDLTEDMIEMPSFMDHSSSISEVEDEEQTIEMPDFSTSSVPQINEEERARLNLPTFSDFQQPLIENDEEEMVETPCFSSVPCLVQQEVSVDLQAEMPEFFNFQLPQLSVLGEETVEIPHFSSAPCPTQQGVFADLQADMPEFSNFQEPLLTEAGHFLLETPNFEPFSFPHPDGEYPILEDEMPEFHSFPHPQSKKELPAHNLSPCQLSFVPHPVIKDFDQLTKTKSYEEIFLLAFYYGTRGDVNMLKHHSQLCTRFLDNIFSSLIEAVSSFLPRSSTFNILLENDQFQIHVLAKFCKDLIAVNKLEELHQMFAQGSLEAQQAIRFIHFLTECGFESELAHQKRLLSLKDTLYCFLAEILKQEHEVSPVLRVSPLKDLSPLEEALSLLADHIKSSAKRLRMHEVHVAECLDFSTWEDRKVTPAADVQMDIPDLGVQLQHPSRVLRNGLLALRHRPEMRVIKELTHVILSLDTSTLTGTCRKANYLLELGDFYGRLPGMVALKRALSWVDLALKTIQSHPDATPINAVLLKCYESRGILQLKMAEELKRINRSEETLPRCRRDASSRDFHLSCALEKDVSCHNFVHKLHQAKSNRNLTSSIQAIEEAIKLDEDYAEAHYHLFLKQFQELQLDVVNMLHARFHCLREESVHRMMQVFKLLICRSSLVANQAIVKIEVASESAYLKFDEQGMLINRVDQDFLRQILTKGIKKASIVSEQKKKIYFCQRISPQDLFQMVQSLLTYRQRLEQIEAGIQAFHAFEITALYKLSLKDDQEPLDCDSIRHHLPTGLKMALLELDQVAIGGYLYLGKWGGAEDPNIHYACALSHICRSIANCQRLLNDPAHSRDHQELKTRIFELFVQRAFIYRRMGLLNCYLSELEEVIALGRLNNPHFCHPSLHYALGMIYQKFGRLEEAREQFYIVQSSAKGATKRIRRKANRQLNAMAGPKGIEKGVAGLREKKESEIMANFQDKNIREECIQILKDHYRANAEAFSHRQVPYWKTFTDAVASAVTLKHFCEQILSFILMSEKVSNQSLLRIVNLANVKLEDPKSLDEIKKYLQDAVKAYQEEKRQIEDQVIEELEKTRVERSREVTFVNFREGLRLRFKDGELLRPGSQKREALTTLVAHLQGIEIDQRTLIRNLEELTGDEIVMDASILTKERIAEIAEILEAALDKEIQPFQVKDHVLQIFGTNIFVSEIKEKIERELREHPAIRDVHIIGLQVYLDTSLKWPGINFGVGGEYVQFMLSQEPGEDAKKKITVDLSGKPGKSGAILYSGPAANGRGWCEKGDDGGSGEDGCGGQPGGDFYVKATQQLVGDNDQIIEKIYLSGGRAGDGSQGQDGGKGHDGKPGENGRDGVESGDIADSMWGYIDLRRATKGLPAGDGGEGGTGGRGGKGGKKGRCKIEGGQGALKAKAEAEDGGDGEDGEPGKGGKAGKPEPDGLDRLYVKGAWIFSSRQKKWGYELYATGLASDRKAAGWASRITIEKTIERNQGKDKDKKKGKTAEQAGRRRKEEKKHDLKKQILKENLAQHIHTQSLANKSSAIDEVTNRLAMLSETETVIVEQLHALQKRIGDIESLYQSTVTALQQTQVQQTAQIQHARLASFTPVAKKNSVAGEIHAFFAHPSRDQANILPFLECSPVAHQAGHSHLLECAMHAVNVTHAQNCYALAELIDELVDFDKEECKEKAKRAVLIQKLTKIVGEMLLRYTLDGFHALVEAVHHLTDADLLKQVIQGKSVQVMQFKQTLEDQKLSINREYEEEIQQLTIKSGILKFLSRLNRILFQIDKNDPQNAGKRWFERSLYHRIMGCARQVMKNGLKQEMVDAYFAYAYQMIQPFSTAPFSSSKELKSKMVSDRKTLQNKVKTLRSHQGWILEHLAELCEQGVCLTDFLKQIKEEGKQLEELYPACVKRWANFFADSSSEKVEDESSKPVVEEEVTDEVKWLQSIQQEQWDSQKVIRLEKRLTELVGLRNKLGTLQPYVEQLRQIYLEPIAHEQLADVFVTILQTKRKFKESLDFIEEIRKLGDCDEIDRLRKKFPRYFKNVSLKDPVERRLAEQIELYLQKKHVELIKQKGLVQLKDYLPSISHQRLLEELTFKLNSFYALQFLLPKKNFLAVAEQVIDELKREATLTPPPEIEVTDSPDISDRILLCTVAEQVHLTRLEDSQLIEQLRESINKKHFEKTRAYLFLLASRSLSYAHILKVIRIISSKKMMRGEKKAIRNLFKTSFKWFSQKAEDKKVKFEMQWQAVMQKGKFYDTIRQQVDKEDQRSIVELLLEIADNAEWREADEKIDILSQMIRIVSTRGCVISISELESLRNQLLIQNGHFPRLPGSASELTDAYHTELESVFNSNEPKNKVKKLPSLLMKVMDQKLDHTFLLPCLTAIQYLPFDVDQLIILLKKIAQIIGEDKKSQALKRRCLEEIKSLLVDEIKRKSQEVIDQRHSIKEELNQKQSELIKKISESIKESAALYSDRQLGSLELWLKRWDHYFEVEKKTDPTGHKRKEIYEKTFHAFKECVENAEAIDQALAQFDDWLRQTFNQEKDQNTIVNLDAVKTLLDDLGDRAKYAETARKLEKFYWRGIIPYANNSDRDSILHYLEERSLDETDGRIHALLKRLKLKFDDAMIQEEYLEVKRELDAFEKEDRQRMSVWLDHMEAWLWNEETTIEEIERDYPRLEELKLDLSSSDALHHPRKFLVDGVIHLPKNTVGDGACSLHALLGEEVNGAYRYLAGNPKQHFCQTLGSVLDLPSQAAEEKNQRILEIYVTNLSSLLDASQSDGDPSAALIFKANPAIVQAVANWRQEEESIAYHIKELRMREVQLWATLFEVALPERLDQHPSLKGKSPQAIRDYFRDEPQKGMNIIGEEKALFDKFLTDHPQADIQAVRQEIQRCNQTRSQKRRDLLVSPLVRENYFRALLEESYYLNVIELQMGAFLFDLQVHVWTYFRGDYLPLDEPYNPTAREKIVILQQNLHFERCVPVIQNRMDNHGISHTPVKPWEKEKEIFTSRLSDPNSVEKEEEFDVRQWLMQLNEKNQQYHFNHSLQDIRPHIETFLQELEKKVTDQALGQQDTDLILLKKLKSFVSHSKEELLVKRVRDVEWQIIELIDRQEITKKESVEHLITQLNKINAFEKLPPEESQDPLTHQYLKDLSQFRKALESSCVLMGEESFLFVIHIVCQRLEGYRGRIDLKMLASLFWVLPRLNDRQIAVEVLNTRLPENWTLVLLEKHCLEAFLSILMQKKLPSISTQSLSDQEKEDLICQIIKEKEKQSRICLERFQHVLDQLKVTKDIGAREKETLLRLIALRLATPQGVKPEFSVEDFIFLLEKYLVSTSVLKKLTIEWAQSYSFIATLLLQPSFESFKYALTLAWMQGMLEPHRLKTADAQKLYASLFEIESTKKVDMMCRVVNSLKGGFLTPAVVECVAYFANRSLELDEATLEILKNRGEIEDWYTKIEDYTKVKRSEGRDLKKLVSLMEEESGGINHSIKELLAGEYPQLMQDIEGIEAKFKSGICHYEAADIKQWAQDNKSTRFLDDPERLKEGIAVISRANELFTQVTKGKKCQLRYTQMIALWLMLRKKSGEQKGRIAQMFTGEGKSFTFAGLAVLRAMSKSCVDVITTSLDLAERDAVGMKKFFDYFDLTVSNNCDQACEQDEEVRKSRYFCKEAEKPIDIIYGDAASFERDLLLTEFHGKEIIHRKRLEADRSVLVDEVDGLFLDNAGMVLYLSHGVDTLRFLERIFTHIWTFANQPYFDNAFPFHDKAIETIVSLVKKKIESNEILLPTYQLSHAHYMEVTSIIERKLAIWVRSALYAKMISVNNHYVITDRLVGKKMKREIIAMDKGTGIEQFSLKWSQGLHQFLQLKHGLELSPDSLKAVFLSNYFFFKRYGQHIYGLSGTLGSETEQKYLQNLYQVDLCKIPRFAPEKYIKYKATVVGTREEWLTCIEKSIKREVKERKRAVLLICDSIEDVLSFEEYLKPSYSTIETYKSFLKKPSFVANEKAKKIGPGDILIATNLAGRGTDLETTEHLEAHKGLHVILSYLPSNIRIEEQAFGRTARSGNEGSGEFIVCDPQRRDISELCRLRDWEEKQRLENMFAKEVKKNKFEHKLLRGFTYRGEKISGFQVILKSVEEALKGKEDFYREAQLNSLKNRWAFWMDHMEEKIKMVHVIGKGAVVASFQKFERGVYADLQAGGHQLIKEPIELIKLGGEYRRQKMWSQAQACYQEAAKDPHYRYAVYYEAACEFIQFPSSSLEAMRKFKRQVKEAIQAIKPEIAQLQTSIQSIVPIVEKYRQKGQADKGTPYSARSEEKIQVWSIFLSAIEGAIGGAFSKESLKKSSFTDDNRSQEIINVLGNRFKPMRLSRKLTVGEGDLFYKGHPLSIPKMFQPMLKDFKAIEASSEAREIDKQKMATYCSKVVTRESVKPHLNCTQTIYKLTSIPPNFEGWPKTPPYSDQVNFVLSSLVDEIVGRGMPEFFHSKEELKALLKEKMEANDFLKGVTIESFFQIIDQHFIKTDCEVDLSGIVAENEGTPLQFSQLKKLKEEGLTAQAQNFPKELREALFKAAVEKQEKEMGEYTYSLKKTTYLGDLALPESSAAAADILWTLLEDKEVIKPSKLKIGEHDFSKQSDKIKEDVENFLKTFFPEDEKLKEALNSIFGIIESSIGMIYKLDSKKKTAEFADIIRKYFHDHKQHAPEGLNFFIELGLEVIADLIEKKDPPAWFEVLAVTVMGVVQMVAGVLIKAYLPIVGELIGNALISTGMDDIMFAINSVVAGEFSWDDYAAAKGQSLKRAIVSSSISCGVSFGVDAVFKGSLGEAWKGVQMTGAERATKAAAVAGGTFNIGTHIAKEVGRSFINMGISQLTSRGIEGMTKLIAGSYEGKIKKGVHDAVNNQWHLVKTQADALYQKLSGDHSILDNIKECVGISLKRLMADNFFDGVIRASRHVVPQVAARVGGGWGELISHAPDIANLGISIEKLINLVEEAVRQLSRLIRETKERKTEITTPVNQVTDFEGELAKRKEEFTSQLIETFNGVLNGAVFAPLVSYGAQELAKAGKELLIPTTEQEKWAEPPERLEAILEARQNGDEALADRLLLSWREANDEVDELSPEQLEQTPLNSGETLGALKERYGNHLKIYKDKEGHLYVQRPSREEFAASMDVEQPVSDPVLVALTHKLHKKIALRSPDGSSKIYSSDDNPLEIEPFTPLETEYVDEVDGQDQPITLDLANTKDLPTLIEALRCQGVDIEKDATSVKQDIASILNENEDCKRFYYEWNTPDTSQGLNEPMMNGENLNTLNTGADFPTFGETTSIWDWHLTAFQAGVNAYQQPIETLKEGMAQFGQPLDPLNPVEPGPLSIYSKQNAHALGQGVGLALRGLKEGYTVLRFFGVQVYNPLERFMPAVGGIMRAHDSSSKQGRRKNSLKTDSSIDQTPRVRQSYPHSDKWKHETHFEGIRVFQRDDLIDPLRVCPKTGETNLQLMQRRKAPFGPDGKRVELHHMIQRQGYPMAEVSGTFHKKNHSIIHINPNTIPGISKRLRRVHGRWRGRYWEERAKGFIPKH